MAKLQGMVTFMISLNRDKGKVVYTYLIKAFEWVELDLHLIVALWLVSVMPGHFAAWKESQIFTAQESAWSPVLVWTYGWRHIFLHMPGTELIILGPPVYDLVTMPTELQLCWSCGEYELRFLWPSASNVVIKPTEQSRPPYLVLKNNALGRVQSTCFLGLLSQTSDLSPLLQVNSALLQAVPVN